MKLRKRDVEVLLADYDADPVGALTVALRVALDSPGGAWTDLVASFEPARRAALLSHDTAALDQLVAELNELRSVATVQR